MTDFFTMSLWDMRQAIEDNVPVWIMVLVVIAVLAVGYAVIFWGEKHD